MNVLVLNNAAPFIRGGAEELAEHLVQRLNMTAGVEAELLRIPFRWEPADQDFGRNSDQSQFAPVQGGSCDCAEISCLPHPAREQDALAAAPISPSL